MSTSVSLGGSTGPQSVSVHFTKCFCSWPAGPVPAPGRVHRHAPIPCRLFSGPGAGMEGMEDAVLEASHSVQGYGCSWGSRSDQEAGLEEAGTWSPKTLHYGSRGWAAHRCRCPSVAAVAAAACPGDEETAWEGTLMEVLSSPHSHFLGVPQAGWAGLGW